MRTLSSSALEALLAPQTDEVLLFILEIDHADLASPIRAVNNTESIVSNGDTYSPLAFEITPPVEEDGTVRATTLSIDAVDRVVIEAIKSIQTPATVSISLIRADAPDTIEVGPWPFILREATYTEVALRCSLEPDYYVAFEASPLSYRSRDFPGLYG